MTKTFEVTRAWFGVKVGDVLEMDSLHPALKSHVRLVREQAVELVPSTPEAVSDKNERKAIIAARLDELEIKFQKNYGEAKLTELLPDGELELLFPAA